MGDAMDTSILGTLFAIAPDLMEEMELRTLVLERVSALGPVGRRALAQRLHLAEREVRSAADALKNAGLITQSAAGMEVTGAGSALVSAARAVSHGRRSLAAMELALARKLHVDRVCVVRGDADMDASVLEEAAHAAADQLRFLLQGAQVLAVSGGRTMAAVAAALDPAAPMDVTVVPAQGGTNAPMGTQANTLAEMFAGRLGGQVRLIHLPEGISPAAAEEMSRLPQVREGMELLHHADVLLYGVGRADGLPVRHAAGAADRAAMMKQEAAGEALGLYFGMDGSVTGGRNALSLRAQELGRVYDTAAVAVGRSKAEAIAAVCMHHKHRLLVTDEGAAARMMELLRV